MPVVHQRNLKRIPVESVDIENIIRTSAIAGAQFASVANRRPLVSARAYKQVFAESEQRVDKIAGGHALARRGLPFGIPEIDSRLRAVDWHMGRRMRLLVGGNDTVTGAVSALFTLGVVARTSGPVIWCPSRPDLFAPALQQVGLDVNRVIFFQCKEDAVLESAEEAIQYKGAVAVVAEVVRFPMVASRRLQLAAEKSGAMGLIIRRWRRQPECTDFGNPMASMTRWRVSALPSEPLPVPGTGRARWFVEMMRAQSGEAFDVELEACAHHGTMAAVRLEPDAWRMAQ